MKRYPAIALLFLVPAGDPPSWGASRPIHDTVGLNIGISCQWQAHCMADQRGAMNRALNYVARTRPPQWRLQLCNRNASRGGGRVDWVGFDHCIHNPALKPVHVSAKRRR